MNLQLNYRARDAEPRRQLHALEDGGQLRRRDGRERPGTAASYTYPEYFDAAWCGPGTSSGGVEPIGDLVTDVRHRPRLGHLGLPLPEASAASTSAASVYNAGTPYGAAGTVDTRPYVTNPGYSTPPASVDLLVHRPRRRTGSPTLQRRDLSLNWPQRLGLGKSELFFRGRMLNVINRDELTNLTGGSCGRPGRLRHRRLHRHHHSDEPQTTARSPASTRSPRRPSRA